MISDLNDAKHFINKVSIKNPPFPVELTISESAIEDELTFNILFKVKHRDSGYDMNLTFAFAFRIPVRDDVLLEFVESRLRAAWLHELHECLHVDGKRLHDPHPYGDGSFNIEDRDLVKPFSTEIGSHK